MGMDIYADSGVIASLGDVIGMIRKKDLKGVKQAIYNTLDSHKDWKKGKEVLKPIEHKTSFDDVISALAKLGGVHGEPSKYGNDDCYVEDSYEVTALWNEIIEQTRPVLPELKVITVFDSGRVNGWDVPLGEVCFIFDASECFEEKMTSQGTQLRKAIGHCTKTEWTEMSV